MAWYGVCSKPMRTKSLLFLLLALVSFSLGCNAQVEDTKVVLQPISTVSICGDLAGIRVPDAYETLAVLNISENDKKLQISSHGVENVGFLGGNIGLDTQPDGSLCGKFFSDTYFDNRPGPWPVDDVLNSYITDFWVESPTGTDAENHFVNVKKITLGVKSCKIEHGTMSIIVAPALELSTFAPVRLSEICTAI